MGYVMDLLHRADGARTREEFAEGMSCLAGRAAWTEGVWDFGGGEVRPWNGIENTPKDIATLTAFLVRIVGNDVKMRKARGAAEPPLLRLAQA